MPQGREDRFANIAAVELTMTAANTLSFAEMLTGISLGQGVGMLIDQIDYYPQPGFTSELVDMADRIEFGITTSNDITSLVNLVDRRILHAMKIATFTVGAVVGLAHLVTPFTFQFFPPMIVASPRLYLGANSTGAGSAGVVHVRLYFRYISLTPQQYLELAEAFILTG